MSNFDKVDKAFDRINTKLDLILELVTAQKDEDWKRVGEVCKKLDELKKIPVLSD
jgi:c-di-GMP-related signal transduction protein